MSDRGPRDVEGATLDFIVEEKRQLAISMKQKPLSVMKYKTEVLEQAEVVSSA